MTEKRGKIYRQLYAYNIDAVKAPASGLNESRPKNPTPALTYENYRRRFQLWGKRKPKTAKKLIQKQVKIFPHGPIHKLPKISGPQACSKDLEKYGIHGNRRIHNRVISRQNYKQIIQLMRCKVKARLLNPKAFNKNLP